MFLLDFNCKLNVNICLKYKYLIGRCYINENYEESISNPRKPAGYKNINARCCIKIVFTHIGTILCSGGETASAPNVNAEHQAIRFKAVLLCTQFA